MSNQPPGLTRAVIIGGGPAGLTAAVELGRLGVPVTVLERDRLVGGIARTESYQGYRFDIGGHPVFTQIGGGGKIFDHLPGAPFITPPRHSPLFSPGKIYNFPPNPL